ncbi:MAG: hypothetical protein J6S75_07730, partial [Thermoguttaceae bacterium]|nr:hypothetical protein [Thermoguttaceae bacterium]
MKKIGSYHKPFLAVFGAAAAWLAVSALGAAELQNDPNLTRNADGVYEISASAPESVRFYSEPIDVVPGGLYRFSMLASWFGDGGGCFPAGVEGATTDYSPAEDETPETLCERVIRMGDNRSQARLCVGRWESKRTTRFTEPTLVPVAAIYKMIWEGEEGAPGEKSAAGAAGTFLPLGSGEKIDGALYTFQAFADWNDGNAARTLDYTDTASNTNRWCFGGGNSVVYRFDLRPISLDAARGAEEPLRFVSADVSVDSHFFVSGRCLVEMSTDGQNWQSVGTLEEKGVVTGTAEELFASPVETLFVRCRAEDNASFQIHGLSLTAALDSDRFTGRGETIYAEVGDDADSADQNFEVTPL